jgi:hypothetical protein
MAATIEAERTNTQLQDWGTLDDSGSGTPYLETSQVDISSEVSCLLHIDMCQDNTAAIGTSAFAIIWGKSGSADEDWHEICKREYGTTACTEVDVSEGADSGDTTMACDTTNFAYGMVGSKVFVSEKGTGTNSFIATVIDWTDANTLWLLDGVGNDITDTAHADKIYCTTASPFGAVAQWNIRMPEECWAAKVSFHNPDADAVYACRVRYSFITDYTSA